MGNFIVAVVCGYVLGNFTRAIVDHFWDKAAKEKARQFYADMHLTRLLRFVPSREVSPQNHIEFTQRLRETLKVEALKKYIEAEEERIAYKPYSSVGFWPITGETMGQ